MKISLAYYLIFLISSLSISCGNDHPEVDRVTVKYIYSGTETFRRISRNEFNGEVGKGGFMSKELQSKRQINQFKPKGLSHSLLSFLHATCDGF
jgi:hypothetical protein